jgi:hypothetical protein
MNKNNVEDLTFNLIMQNYNEKNYKTIQEKNLQNNKKIKKYKEITSKMSILKLVTTQKFTKIYKITTNTTICTLKKPNQNLNKT